MLGIASLMILWPGPTSVLVIPTGVLTLAMSMILEPGVLQIKSIVYVETQVDEPSCVTVTAVAGSLASLDVILL